MPVAFAETDFNEFNNIIQVVSYHFRLLEHGAG
jgi:hypothetical protein